MFRPIDNEQSFELVQGNSSIYNSINRPLLSLETFTGQWEQNFYSDVGVSLQMDTNGILYFDFSNDAVHVNTFPVSGFSISSGIHEFHTAVKLGRFFRVRVINHGGNQGYCRLFTYYGSFRQGNLPLGSSINDDTDCIVVRNPYDDVDIARGNVQSVFKFSKFGEGTVSTTLVPVTSSLQYQTPTTAQTLEIVSSDVRDDQSASPDNSGAWSVFVEGLDSTWAEISETVNLSGTIPVLLSNQYIRVYRLRVVESGSYATSTLGSHRGTITLRNSGGGVVWGNIPIIHNFPTGQSLIAAYTVPTGKVLYLDNLSLSSNTTKTVSALFFRRDNADDTSPGYTPMRTVRTFDGIDNVITVPIKGFAAIPSKCDVGVMAVTTAGSADVTAEFSGYLIDE